MMSDVGLGLAILADSLARQITDVTKWQRTFFDSFLPLAMSAVGQGADQPLNAQV